ncbi:MAG TPA: hypothetical protein VD699_01395 [Nitrosopumilaceae archaeon]|nr:hypothetical protein [Nitrosopumilaceae archaeon]
MARIRALIVIGLILITSLTPIQSFAIHKSEKLSWQMVFLSSYPACSNYQYQILNKYDVIAEKYMDVYNLENSKYKPNCMSESKYSDYKVPDDLDLLILVYDKNIGEKELNGNDIGGFYNHVGTDKTKNHTIVFCDCPNFRFSDPVWILTHELSHFILYYKGFPQDIVEDKIHKWDSKYDYCIETVYDDSCTPTSTSMYDERSGYSWVVMALYEPATMTEFFPSPEKKIIDSQYVVQVQKEITRWWMSGKISEEDYSKTLSYMIVEDTVLTNTTSSYFDTSNIIFVDGPKDKKSDVTYYDSSPNWTEAQLDTIFSRVQFKAEPEPAAGLPEWFKTRAQLWVNDEIGNEEFLSGVKYLITEETQKTN